MQFTSYVSSRLYQQLEYYFQNEQNLAGHVLFRCFNERRAFESQLAEKLWKEAEQKGVHALTYRIPKGEIGLLPGKYLAEMGLIANGQFMKQSTGDLFVPRKFASNISGTMRNPYDDIQ